MRGYINGAPEKRQRSAGGVHFLERGGAPERLLAFSRKDGSVCLKGCDDDE